MKCRECANARMFAEGGVFCVTYGMIIQAEHECTREGGRLRGTFDDFGDDEPGETELHENGGSAS